MENFSSRPEGVPERVREQYNRAPYPQVSWLATCPQTSITHATYESGAALTFQKIESHRNKRIGLLGCGTFEPYAMGTWQPGAQIDAVDLSGQSLNQAKRRCFLHGTRNVTFHENDLNKFCRLNESAFDYIHCFGVLHHLENPKIGFRSISRALKPQGFARIMVYSKTSRRRPQLIRQASTLLFQENQRASQVKNLMEALPWDHPLKLSFLINSDNQTESGIIDSSLHACEHSFSLQELLDILDESGLHLAAWDFSQNILDILNEEKSESTLEKIFKLEAFDQWPTSFTFWVKKKEGSTALSSANQKIYAPLAPPWPWRRSVYSTVLRRAIKLSADHLRIWRLCKSFPQAKETLKMEPLNELLSARFLLEVSP